MVAALAPRRVLLLNTVNAMRKPAKPSSVTEVQREAHAVYERAGVENHLQIRQSLEQRDQAILTFLDAM